MELQRSATPVNNQITTQQAVWIVLQEGQIAIFVACGLAVAGRHGKILAWDTSG
jgi:hypothetical protein